MQRDLIDGLDDPFDERVTSSFADMFEWKQAAGTKFVEEAAGTPTTRKKEAAFPLPLLVFLRTQSSAALLKNMMNECNSLDGIIWKGELTPIHVHCLVSRKIQWVVAIPILRRIHNRKINFFRVDLGLDLLLKIKMLRRARMIRKDLVGSTFFWLVPWMPTEHLTSWEPLLLRKPGICCLT